MKKILLLLLLATSACAQTLTNSVTFNLTDWLQTAYVNRPVTIQGVSMPRTNPPYIAVNYLLNTNSGSTGSFTLTNILDGTYRVTIAGSATPSTFSIYVPTNQGAVHSASSLITTSIVDSAVTAYTKAQANSLFVSRAGTNASLRTNGGFVFVDVTGGGGGSSVTGAFTLNGGYGLTIVTNGTTNTASVNTNDIATRGYADAQILSASNVLATRITTASNGLQAGIDGKTNRFPLSGGGITIASATTNGVAFDVFTVSGTGGTAPTNLPGTGILITTNNANSHTFTVDTNMMATRAWAAEADTVVSNSIESTINSRIGVIEGGVPYIYMETPSILAIRTGNTVFSMQVGFDAITFDDPPYSDSDAVAGSQLTRLSQVISRIASSNAPIASSVTTLSNIAAFKRETLAMFASGATNSVELGTNFMVIVPYNCTIETNNVMAAVNRHIPPTGSQMRFRLLTNGVSIMSTDLHIDATETSSLTAATNFAFSTTNLVRGSFLELVTIERGSTIPGSGAHVWVPIKATTP